jgi:hypothetical protein
MVTVDIELSATVSELKEKINQKLYFIEGLESWQLTLDLARCGGT